jgi:hypothetical protein
VTVSPTLPAFALLFVVVPTMPAVCEGVIAPVAESVVNAPVLGAVFPTAVPLSPLLADSVVNAPLLGVVLPTAVLFKPLLAVRVVNEPVLPLMGEPVMPSVMVTAPLEFEIVIGVSTDVPAGEYLRTMKLPVDPP